MKLKRYCLGVNLDGFLDTTSISSSFMQDKKNLVLKSLTLTFKKTLKSFKINTLLNNFPTNNTSDLNPKP